MCVSCATSGMSRVIPSAAFRASQEARACTRSAGVCYWRAWRWTKTSCMRSVMRPSYFRALESEGVRRGSGVRSKPRWLRRSGCSRAPWPAASRCRFITSVYIVAERLHTAEMTKRTILRCPTSFRMRPVVAFEELLRSALDAVERPGGPEDVHMRLPSTIGRPRGMHRPHIGMRVTKGFVQNISGSGQLLAPGEFARQGDFPLLIGGLMDAGVLLRGREKDGGILLGPARQIPAPPVHQILTLEFRPIL